MKRKIGGSKSRKRKSIGSRGSKKAVKIVRRSKPRSGKGKVRARKGKLPARLGPKRIIKRRRQRSAAVGSGGNAYNAGFNLAYNEGYNAGFAKGFEDGHLIAYEQQV